MDFVLLAFYAFGAVAVASALGVIASRNPLHAALFLVLTFFSVACGWIIAGAEFLGVALILVYVGAVMVLMLFVVMMLDIDVASTREGFVKHLPLAAVVAAVMLVEIVALIGARARMVVPFAQAPQAAEMGNTRWLASVLFTEYLLPFELAAVILTVAVIAAVMLSLRRRSGVHQQSIYRQVTAKPSDRLRMVKMAPVLPAAADAVTQPASDGTENAT